MVSKGSTGVKGLQVAVLGGALLLFSGCGSSVEKDAEYASASMLRDALVGVGYECPQWSDEDTTTEFDAARCLSDDRDFLRVYPDVAAREADLEGAVFGTQLMMATGRVETALLVGPNWTLSGPTELVTPLQETMGGFFPDLSDVRLP